MKLALYLPNFRDKVTVSELDDLAHLAEELEFDSIWTLDRIVVPESSDRGELRKPFGFMKEFPRALPVISRGEFLHGLPLVPYLAAITKKVRIGVSIIDTPYRAPGVLAAEIGTWDHLAGGRINVGVDELFLALGRLRRIEERVGGEVDVVRCVVGDLQKQRRVVTVAAEDGLVDASFAKLLDERADLIRAR